jgi:hypothetical protein
MRRPRHLSLQLAAILTLCLAVSSAEARRFLDAINDADRAILDDLHNGAVVEARPFGENGNMGKLWKVRIEHNGRSRWAVFKPRSFGDRDGWARTPMEVAVYKLNRVLGLDLVPPSAYRRNLTLGGQYFAEGALSLWVDDAHKIWNVPEQEWSPRREAFSSDLRILQSIGRDADNQNGNNLIRGRHWKDGKYRVMKVDNEACMRSGSYVNLDHGHPEWGPVTRFNRQTYDRLRELSFADLKMDVGEFLSDDEIRDWLRTRDGLVGTIDSQARQRDVWFRQNEIAFDARVKVGKDASSKLLRKFEALMKRKGVKVEYVAPSDLRLEGALGRTGLSPDGKVTVRLAKGWAENPKRATLVEEQVHVNQLLKMASQAGSLRGLYTSLNRKGGKDGRAIRLSMEEYAAGKVALTLTCKPDLSKVRRAEQKLHAHAVRCTGGACASTRELWKTAIAPRVGR